MTSPAKSNQPRGLSHQEAQRGLKKYGPNVLVARTKRHPLHELLLKFKNPLVLILLFAALISAFTGELINFLLIFSMVILSVLLDFYQEYQSNSTAEKLRQKVAVRAVVWRGGTKQELPVTQLTVGDSLELALGSLVPADARIRESKDLHVDESTLTGESFPVEKEPGAMVYAGSSVVNGEARAEITAVGQATRLGHMAQSLNDSRPLTDFEKGINNFGLLVMKITVILTVAIFAFNAILKGDIFNSFLFALALAVGLTPELLPMIVTVNLAQGARRLAHRGVIVKHLPSIQNLGAMNILCTDKTGTITENKIKLERYEDVTGSDNRHVLKLAYLNSFFQSNQKNPLDEAVLAHHAEVSPQGFTKVDEIPFDFTRKRLSVIVASHTGKLLICKGAPESVLKNCRHFAKDGEKLPLTEAVRATIDQRYQTLSKEGYRCLAISARESVTTPKKVYAVTDEANLTFIGLTAFLDPPKAEVKEVLKSLGKEGISLKILTGDNELVTRKVCEELEIKVIGVLTGTSPLFNGTDKDLQDSAAKANLFVRLNPEQKVRVIKVLRSEGNVVGYLGDGINDAASLRAADVGISVANAVDVAKEAADIILLTKSLKVLRDGVLGGRHTFANVLKYLVVGMGSNFGNMLSVCLISLFLPFLPMLPIQILLNNMIYDLSQISLPLDHVDPEHLTKPQRWDSSLIKKYIFTFGPISSLFDFLTFFFLLFILHATIPLFRTGWFIESLTTQSLVILALRTRAVPFFRSQPHPALLLTSFGAVLVGLLFSQTALGQFFEFVPVPPTFWLFLGGVVLAYLTLVELTKKFFYRHLPNH